MKPKINHKKCYQSDGMTSSPYENAQRMQTQHNEEFKEKASNRKAMPLKQIIEKIICNAHKIIKNNKASSRSFADENSSKESCNVSTSLNQTPKNAIQVFNSPTIIKGKNLKPISSASTQDSAMSKERGRKITCFPVSIKVMQNKKVLKESESQKQFLTNDKIRTKLSP